MNILIIEPYFTGSHADWVKGYRKFSCHDVEILSLTGQFWKWRMHGGAITLAQQYLERKSNPDLILATDMLDLTTFLALTKNHSANIPVAVYFHENQLCYPWSANDRDVVYQRDKHYGFINHTTALAADAVFFNSRFHLDAFLKELKKFLKHFPDHRGLENVDKIKQKSEVLPLGLDLQRFDKFKPQKLVPAKKPLILWNHRWEYDKNPVDFFNALYSLAENGYEFEVALLGENFSQQPTEFVEAQKKLSDRIVQYGYSASFEDYAKWLWQADIIPVTSNQDFFGASAVEAIYCGCYPILPDRLSFPEIFPIERFPQNFYSSTNELITLLQKSVEEIAVIRQQNFKTEAIKFCWQQIVSSYDDKFREVALISNSLD